MPLGQLFGGSDTQGAPASAAPSLEAAAASRAEASGAAEDEASGRADDERDAAEGEGSVDDAAGEGALPLLQETTTAHPSKSGMARPAITMGRDATGGGGTAIS
jgi:hypothetical protein